MLPLTRPEYRGAGAGSANTASRSAAPKASMSPPVLTVFQPCFDAPGTAAVDYGWRLVVGQQQNRPLVRQTEDPVQGRTDLQKLLPKPVDLARVSLTRSMLHLTRTFGATAISSPGRSTPRSLRIRA